MIELRATVVLLLMCLSLTGCLYYPITAPAADASALSSPYPVTDITGNGDVLRVHLNDPSMKDADFRRMKLIETVLTTEAGKQSNLKLLNTSYSKGVTFLFQLPAETGHFGLQVTTSLDNRAMTITGKLWVHEEGKMISWHDLDHG